MKLILIVLVFLGGLGYCSWRVYDFFDSKAEYGKQKQIEYDAKLAAEKLAEENPPVPVVATDAPGPADPGAVPPGDLSPVSRSEIKEVVSVGHYRFENRLVPEAPGFLRDDTKVGMVVQTDASSNSWVWIGSPVLGSQIHDLAKSYDVAQVEMDLDFVLVLVNAERLKSRGLSIFYSDGAGWLDALSLRGDAGSLRISAGGFAVDLDIGSSTTGFSLLSQPVIRCLDGQPWKFATDSEVPVPFSEVIDGVVRQSLNFRPIGFGLEGVSRVVGKKILLTIEQRNGSISPAASTSSEAPIFNSQTLNTTCELAWLEWSVLGGIQVDKEELRQGIFRNSLKASSDYLVIFCRPRPSLEAPPAAYPVLAGDDGNPLLDGPSLLPPRSWLDTEIQRVEHAMEHGSEPLPDWETQEKEFIKTRRKPSRK